jgi:glycolate oxidase
LIPILSKVEAIVGRRYVSTATEDLLCYAYDATNRHHLPDGVVFPGKSEEVSAIMKVANEAGLNIVPRGAGTGMSGGALAIQGGLVMVMTRFDRILSVDEENLVAEVEPGVITAHFQEVVESKGLFYPPDPASAKYSTLGGNVAECAGGPRAVKYGVTRDYILGLEVVLPSGEIITTGVRTAKGVVGYDLTRLIAGSEGTLGIVTKIILRLVPLPEVVHTLGAVFGDIRDAAWTVSEIVRSGLMPRTLEYMDQAAIRCVEDYLKMGLPVDAGAMLLVETDGNPSAADRALEVIISFCEKGGGCGIRLAKSDQEAKALWRAREAISPALFRLGPHKINEDIVVPRARIPDMVVWIEDLRRRTGLTMVTFGHAGDGNIHFNIMLDQGDKQAVNKAEAAVRELFEHTVSLGGTISGEHGVGITKAPYLHMELGGPAIALMKRIKAAFDPKGILNPGKIFPPSVSSIDDA